eukprot:TRINITY_DN2627_c0_g1_i1.p1 TRINITY_DN2627_c0_g1~~TRINITY_DN2627_c0_g1_i1.p1  ORF type:complete len:221 (+),score=31.01 TRINITY_DN2627_c0_g1_i1:53-715(+)
MCIRDSREGGQIREGPTPNRDNLKISNEISKKTAGPPVKNSPLNNSAGKPAEKTYDTLPPKNSEPPVKNSGKPTEKTYEMLPPSKNVGKPADRPYDTIPHPKSPESTQPTKNAGKPPEKTYDTVPGKSSESIPKPVKSKMTAGPGNYVEVELKRTGPPSKNATPPRVPPAANKPGASLCDRCQEVTATKYCENCEVPLCEQCQKDLHAKGKWMSHTIIPL